MDISNQIQQQQHQRHVNRIIYKHIQTVIIKNIMHLHDWNHKSFIENVVK